MYAQHNKLVHTVFFKSVTYTHVFFFMFRGLQEKINQILRSFEEMKSRDMASSQTSVSNTDPSTRFKLLNEEMKRVGP